MENEKSIHNIKEAFGTFFNVSEIISLKSTIDSIFSALNEWLQSDKVKNIITGLAELQKLHTISEYGWCICDEELRDKISSEGSISEDKIDNLIVSYYAKNNYEKLKEKLEMWEKAPFLKERMPIIKSCLYATDKIDGEILFNMAIPTLLAQEDGILEDMYNLIPEDARFDIAQSDHLNSNQTKNIITSYLWYNGYGAIAIYVLKVLVQKTFLNGKTGITKLSQEELEKYDKFRNKILHGDKNYLKYGTLKNYIQSWLELELLFYSYMAIFNTTQKNVP